MPPIITPFVFRNNAQEGLRVMVNCLLERGDHPVKFEWLKDGLGINSDIPKKIGDIRIQFRALDAYSSQLVIPELSAEHQGNYTCRASNKARTATHSAVLTVSGKVNKSHMQLLSYLHRTNARDLF